MPEFINKIKSPATPKKTTASSGDSLRHFAFDNAAQANIISNVSSGKIIMANSAACKLLGYKKKELLTKTSEDIFDVKESSFKTFMKQRKAKGQSIALVIAIQKKGKHIPCAITSGIFMDDDGVQKAIISIANMSQYIRNQQNIDAKKDKIVANNITLAKSVQKRIDTEKEKTVAHNITLAREKSDARLHTEIRLKEKQIAEAAEDARDIERSDIRKELHDNVNQLLSASRVYLGMAKRERPDWEMFLNRSSDYTLSAIAEIRKLTRGLTGDLIKNLGLCDAVENLCRDMMETSQVIISCSLGPFNEHSVPYKFKVNIYRIVQEHLSNILKHAKATEVAVSFLQNTKFITVIISDNGIGFDTDKKHSGIGIENIKSRVVSYSGTAVFASKPGQGCVLTVIFPVKSKL